MRNVSLVLSVVIAGLFIFVAGCNKNQKVVRQLDGDWKVTEIRYNNVIQDLTGSSYEYSFEKCRVRKEDCSGTYRVTDPAKGTTSYPFTYSIQEGGAIIIINLSIMGQTDTSEGDILEHSDSKFVWGTKETIMDMDGELQEVDVVTTIEKL